MRTQKEIERDLYDVCGGAGYLTSEQIQRYLNYGKDKTTNFLKKYDVTFLGETKGRRYDLKDVAEAIRKSQCNGKNLNYY